MKIMAKMSSISLPPKVFKVFLMKILVKCNWELNQWVLIRFRHIYYSLKQLLL